MRTVPATNYDLNPAFYNESFFLPYFQPIINVTTQMIMGYEVLGRIFSPSEGNYLSLGFYFHNLNEDELSVYNVDRIIREKAFRYLKESNLRTKLFLNIMPRFLSRVHKTDLKAERFHVIQLIEKYGINKNNIVLEITEDEFLGSIENLIQMVEIFRNYGLKIAIDDLGVGFSNLERIGYIHPDIIKVDVKIIRESLNKNSFKQVLSSVSDMSQKLGSMLLFEGIENEEEVNLALSMGANLLQGYYFAKPDKNFINKHAFSKKLKNLLEKFSSSQFLEFQEIIDREEALIEKLEKALEFVKTTYFSQESELTGNELLTKLLPYLPYEIKLAILTDAKGYQTTSTFYRNQDGEFEENLAGVGNNYAWKPYFIKHRALASRNRRKWNVTPPLYDLQTKKEYVVFSYSITPNCILLSRIFWEQ